MTRRRRDPRIPKTGEVARALTNLGDECSGRFATHVAMDGRLPVRWGWRGVRAILAASDDPEACLDALCERQEQRQAGDDR